MIRLRVFLRQLFCRHEVGLLTNWDVSEICCYVVCPKCGRTYGHYHIPVAEPKISDRPERRVH